MRKTRFVPLFLFLGLLLAGCGAPSAGPNSAAGTVGGSQRRGLARSGDTIYETFPGTSTPDYSRPVRNLQPGESFDPNQPFAVQSPTPYATPDAAEIKRGEDLENQEAREAEEKAAHANDPANQVKDEQEKIENQIQQEQEKAEGNN